MQSPPVLSRCLVVFLFGGNPRIKTPLNRRETRRARAATRTDILVRVGGLRIISHTRGAYPFAKRLEEKDGFNRRHLCSQSIATP
jgi:hypothetical protein